jgi:hypothetical protein
VRAVFNLALGADNPVNKRTASNALLQMLNTICKRVTQIQPRLTGGSSECSSRTASEALELYRTTSGMSCPTWDCCRPLWREQLQQEQPLRAQAAASCSPPAVMRPPRHCSRTQE